MTPPADRATGQGSGKLILFGEHAVVWGARALATSLPDGALATVRHTPDAATRLTLLRDNQTLAQLAPDLQGGPLEQALATLIAHFECAEHGFDIRVDLNVPPGAGLGSSAALATAIARALATLYPSESNPRRIERAVEASEGIFHSSASGIDQAASLGQGLIHFEKGPPARCTALHDIPAFTIAICQAAPGASTATMVQGVTSRRAKAPERYRQLASMISDLVEDALEAMRTQDLTTLGELVNFNHGLLCAMGVSTHSLDHACHIAREAGSPGAKLTGAGGGGCVYALAHDPAHAQRLVHTWQEHGFQAFFTTIAG